MSNISRILLDKNKKYLDYVIQQKSKNYFNFFNYWKINKNNIVINKDKLSDSSFNINNKIKNILNYNSISITNNFEKTNYEIHLKNLNEGFVYDENLNKNEKVIFYNNFYNKEKDLDDDLENRMNKINTNINNLYKNSNPSYLDTELAS